MNRPLLLVAALAPVLLTFAALREASSVEPIANVEIGSHAELRVNGKPFLPLMLWLQSESRIPDGVSIGVNTFAGNGGDLSNSQYLKALAANGLYGVLSFDREAAGHSHLLGWIHGDEPDLPRSVNVLLAPPRSVPRSAPEEVHAEYQKIKQADPTRPIFVTFTANFMREFDRYDQAAKEKLYPAFVKSCDVAGFDVYPIFGWNKPEWLYRVADGVSELKSIAGPRRPVYAWIETNKGSRWVSPEKQLDVRPEDTRAEVWMAIIRGATAIGYFTHRWTPDYRQFAPEGKMAAELKRLNGQLTRLAPAILAAPADREVKMSLSDGLSRHVKATKLDGALYLFAQNTDMKRKAATGTFSIDGLPSGAKIEVLDENRSLAAGDGQFSDRFESLAEHVYRIDAEAFGRQ